MLCATKFISSQPCSFLSCCCACSQFLESGIWHFYFTIKRIRNSSRGHAMMEKCHLAHIVVVRLHFLLWWLHPAAEERVAVSSHQSAYRHLQFGLTACWEFYPSLLLLTIIPEFSLEETFDSQRLKSCHTDLTQRNIQLCRCSPIPTWHRPSWTFAAGIACDCLLYIPRDF